MNAKSTILRKIHQVIDLPEDLYHTLPQYIRMIQNMAGLSSSCLFLIDYYNGEIPYVSPRILSRKSCDAIQQEPDQFFAEHIPAEEQTLFLKSNKACLQFIHSQDPETRQDFTFSYSLHLMDGPVQYAMHLNISPIALSPEGTVWLAMGSLDPATDIDVGSIFLRRKSVNRWYKYASTLDSFVQVPPLILSNAERELLLLIAKGLSLREIAHYLHRTLHAIISRKRKVFKKLNATSKSQALIRAQNLRLL